MFRAHGFALTAAGLTLAAAQLPAAPVDEPGPLTQVHTGAHWIWYAPKNIYARHQQDIAPYFDYADKAYERLCGLWGLPLATNRCTLFVNPQTGGGFASGDIAQVHQLTGQPSPGVGVAFDAFFNRANGIEGYWGYALITHEMVNLFTGQIVSGGWPVDWWADHVSPFPLMTAVEIETALKPEVAVVHARQIDAPLVRMFAELKDQYGWYLFRHAFGEAIADGIDWNRLGANPSPLRTNYVCAYLQLGAPEDLSPRFKGVVPNFDADAVAAILKTRQAWRALPQGSAEREKAKAAYLRGQY